MPESPRWLIATGRKKEAIAVLEKAALVNKRDPKKIKSTVLSFCSSNELSVKPKFSTLFSTPILRKRSFLLCSNWYKYISNSVKAIIDIIAG